MQYFFLIKFGEKQHLEQLQKEGLIYCNSIKYFAEVEQADGKKDITESYSKLEYFEKTFLYIREAENPHSKWLKIKVEKGQYIESHQYPLGNLYCMSAIPVKPYKNLRSLEINNKLEKLGKHCLLIHDQNKFFERLDAELEKTPFSYCRKKVKYINLKKFSGQKNLSKRINYLTTSKNSNCYSYGKHFSL
jgi:hypothetical protein